MLIDCTRTPYEQGGWDYYYYHPPIPCKRNAAGALVYTLSDNEKAEYMNGYNQETSRKNWG